MKKKSSKAALHWRKVLLLRNISYIKQVALKLNLNVKKMRKRSIFRRDGSSGSLATLVELIAL